MEYRVVLQDDLGLDAAEFVETWNSHPEYRSRATAQLTAGSANQYDGGLLAMTAAALLTLAGGIATSAIYDFIKYALMSKKREEHNFRVEEVRHGETIIFVVVREKRP